MDIKIPKEIRLYKETTVLNLTARQLIFVILAGISSVTTFLTLRKTVEVNLLSIICVFVSAPFAALGFLEFHGMTAEEFIFVWFRYTFMQKKLSFKSKNFYQELLNAKTKEGLKKKNTGKIKENK